MTESPREERRRRVIELHNQGMGTREIAKRLHISFTDIAKILKEENKKKEADQQQKRQEFLSSRAYQLFSEQKSPVQVAIELNIRSDEAITLQREYWDLAGLHNLNLIYEEINANPWPLVNLWNSVKRARMGLPHIVNLLKISNNDLPELESEYLILKSEVKSIKQEKTSLHNQITELGSNLEYHRVQIQREIDQLKALQERRKRVEALANQSEKFSEYVKIRKTVEEKVCAMLSDSKAFIYLALDCLIESIKANPDKYSPLINENRPLSFYIPPAHYAENPFGQQQHANYFDTKRMLAEDASRMYELLSKDLAEEILDNYTVTKSQQPSLPLLPSNRE